MKRIIYLLIFLIPIFVICSYCDKYCSVIGFMGCYSSSVGPFGLFAYFIFIGILELILFSVCIYFLKRFSKKYNSYLVAGVISLLFFIGSSVQSNCLQVAMAFQSQNDFFCNLITKDSLKSECLLKMAIKNNDLSLCKRLLSGKPFEHMDHCYYHFALKERNSSLCENIFEKKRNMSCYRTVPKLADVKLESDLSYCEKLSISEEYNCYRQVAGKCEKFTDEVEKDICYFRVAEKGVFCPCEKITDFYLKDEECHTLRYLKTNLWYLW